MGVKAVLLAAGLALVSSIDVNPHTKAALQPNAQQQASLQAASSNHVVDYTGEVAFIEEMFTKDLGWSLGGLEAELSTAAASNETVLLEIGAQAEKVHGYCEICTRMMQMYQRRLPDVCSGLTDTFFITVSGAHPREGQGEGPLRSSGCVRYCLHTSKGVLGDCPGIAGVLTCCRPCSPSSLPLCSASRTWSLC